MEQSPKYLYTEAQFDDLDKLKGTSIDISPWAYEWRADRDTQETPEAYFIPRRLERLDKVYRTALPVLGENIKSIYYNQPDMLEPLLPPPTGELLAGLLWVGGVSNYRVELRWPDCKAIPSPDNMEVRTYPTAWGWFGWTVDKILIGPEISGDGRVWTYRPQPNEMMDFAYSQRVVAATEMVAVFARGEAAVPEVRVTGESVGTWKRIDIKIEWGFGGSERSFNGQIAAHVAHIGQVQINGCEKRAVVPALYSADSRYGLDSRLTIYLGDTGATVLIRELENNPVYIPELGLLVSKSDDGFDAGEYVSRLTSGNAKNIRQLVREHREASSWEEVLDKVRLWRCREGIAVPPFPHTSEPAAVFEVPDAWWTGMYRAAVDQLRGRHMWGTLAFEVGRVSFEMELVGLHGEADKIYDYFLKSPGVKSDGDYSDPAGSLEWATSMRHDIGYSHEGTHCSTGRLLYSMAQRYFLTGDGKWLTERLPRLKAAADWIINERRSYMADVPNRGQLHVAGLMPPSMLGDYALPACDWRWYYVDNALALMGLRRFADALEALDESSAEYYMGEAEAFRGDMLAVVEREALISPVRRGSDGMYRSFIPRMAYGGGLLHYGPETNIPNFAMGISDLFAGALPLADIHSLTGASDRRIIGTIDAMEEYGTSVSLSSLLKIKHPTSDGTTACAGMSENADEKKPVSDDLWFWNSFVNLPKASYNANIYLLQDDIPNFLRFFLNAAITMVGANGKLWEHAHPDIYEDCLDPDNGTSGWFVENFRNMLLMEEEEGDGLWIAKGTPRAWLEQGRSIHVKDAPTYYGALEYEIRSNSADGVISAAITVPGRRAPRVIKLRLRHPDKAMIKEVMVNGERHMNFDAEKETIYIENPSGILNVAVYYIP